MICIGRQLKEPAFDWQVILWDIRYAGTNRRFCVLKVGCGFLRSTEAGTNQPAANAVNLICILFLHIDVRDVMYMIRIFGIIKNICCLECFTRDPHELIARKNGAVCAQVHRYISERCTRLASQGKQQKPP